MKRLKIKFEDAVLRERYRLLSEQIPLLYSIVLLSLVPLAISFYEKAPFAYVVLAPIVVSAFVISRAIYWLKAQKKVDSQPIAIMRRDMRRTTIIGPLMAFALTVLGIVIVEPLHPYDQAVGIVTIWISVIASAFCLFALPAAAYSVIAASAVPILAAFFYTGKPMLMLAATLISTVACMMIFMLRKNYGTFSEIICSRAQISEARRLAEMAHQEAARLANSDFLTGLSNRRHFMMNLSRRLESERSAVPFAIAMIDLNGFKPVNDTYGHAMGDEVLKQVGARLGRLMEARGQAARFGGDEFGLLIEGVTTEREAMVFCHEVRDCFNTPFELPVGMITIGAGCGVALHSHSPNNATRLMECADIALYRCKGPNRQLGAVYQQEEPPPDPPSPHGLNNTTINRAA